MPIIFNLQHRDIAEENYASLLRAALSRFDMFSLVWPANLPYLASRHSIGHDLQWHQIGKKEDRVQYRFVPDALPVLLPPGSLFSWRFPIYPEDLSFYRNARPGVTATWFCRGERLRKSLQGYVAMRPNRGAGLSVTPADNQLIQWDGVGIGIQHA